MPGLDYVVIAAMLIVIAGAVAILGWRRPTVRAEDPDRPPPFNKREHLLTPKQRAVYDVLEQVLRHPTIPGGQAQARVFANVRLDDLLWMPRRTSRAGRGHEAPEDGAVDFVLCSVEELSPFLVIELNDRTHVAPAHQKSDDFKARALERAGIPVLRVSAAACYDKEGLAAAIRRRIAHHT